MSSRLTEVDPERLAGWVERFAASHGSVDVAAAGAVLVGPVDAPGDVLGDLAGTHPADRPAGGATGAEPGAAGGGLRVVAADGAVAELELLWPAAAPLLGLADVVAAAAAPRTAGVLLVRRGGWAAGLVRGGRLLQGSTGTRYVQSRTAAGGWSQQRYARRREGQAAELVAAATGGAAHLAVPHPSTAAAPSVLLVGGDRALVAAVLAEPALAAWARLPRSPLLDVPDPRRAVLDAVAARARRVRVTVTDP